MAVGLRSFTSTFGNRLGRPDTQSKRRPVRACSATAISLLGTPDAFRRNLELAPCSIFQWVTLCLPTEHQPPLLDRTGDDHES